MIFLISNDKENRRQLNFNWENAKLKQVSAVKHLSVFGEIRYFKNKQLR